MIQEEIKQQLIWADKVPVAEGQDDFTRGHVSYLLPDDSSRFFMKPHGVEITLANFLTIDLEGNIVAGTSRRHSEVNIHPEIYKLRPDVHCVDPRASTLFRRAIGNRRTTPSLQPARAFPRPLSA